ncbi:MAG: zinc-binding dehydrogenase [Nitrospirales bacterium]
MVETSKAAVFVGHDKPFEVQEFRVPELEPGAVLIRMRMAAICGTDAHAAHQANTPAPVIFGHENLGILAEARGITHDVLGQPLKEGDRVFFRTAPCGKCFTCMMGERCMTSPRYGFLRADQHPYLTGGFSQFVYVQPEPWLLRIPDTVSDERALLAVIGNPVSMNGLERMGGIALGDTVVVQGSGPVGMGALNQVRLVGAGRVIVIGAPAPRLALAKEMGADEVIDIAELRDPNERVERILELCGGRGADVVIECSGAPSAVEEGLKMVRYGGKYLVIGQWTDYGPQPINPATITRKALHVTGVYAAERRHTIRSLTAMDRLVQYPVERLITHQFPLYEVNEAFAAHESLKAMVAVIRPNG